MNLYKGKIVKKEKSKKRVYIILLCIVGIVYLYSYSIV